MSTCSTGKLICSLAAVCSGCDRLHLDRSDLEADRRAELARLGLSDVPIDFVWIDDGRLRDRLEFTLEPELNGRMKLGLFEKEKEGVRSLLDIELCPQLSPALQDWLTEFRRDLPVVRARRSVRLRVAPSGVRGVWLDFANEDIRDLLDEGSWLARRLADGVVVEMGQKRKRVIASEAGPRSHRLVDPVLEPWFETVRADLSPTPLFATIGTFTQPGFVSTRALVKTVLDHVETSGHATGFRTKPPRIAEFGAGVGCFTLPLLSTGAYVDVFESDRLALEALEMGARAAGFNSDQLKVHAGDFILSSKAADRAFGTKDNADSQPAKYDTVVVDPPRPGLGRFIDAIDIHAKGANWIYISCYPESFAVDARALNEKGLTLQRISIVEQFPFTRHFEIVASFTG